MEQLNNNEYNILVVEDDKEIRDGIEIFLKSQGYHVYKAADGVEGLQIIEKEPIHLAIVDIMMPRMDGVTMTIKLREHHEFPVIMLSAKSEETDKVIGLNIGADDYVTKPFTPLELMARVNSQLRRYTRYNEADKAGDCRDIIDFNGLVINRATHECTLYDRELGLTPIEFDILWMLCENRGQVISAERLFESVWGEKYLDRNNTVMVHIRRLREKMGEPSRNPRFIKTVWGVGYKID